ncbi:Na(+)/H(+) antiporter subunit C [Aciduricibacillus chroicocephali]|uniref:Na(+)/H(+) antiporter subunit C n=1 Tax=Aciduricibacillus chroicocephali TaxID=3054939 RepID=A0ABY9KUX4_9BACI|nr:Na(+)/H(+) antiporter subunit C [Bacillaceae bacterium 44XB]
METMMIILSGVLVTVGTYLLLSKSLLRVILGTSVLSHAVHILLMALGGLKTGREPLVGKPEDAYVDALPQALILTAIVIGFAVTAIFLVVAYKTYQETGYDQIDQLRRSNHE